MRHVAAFIVVRPGVVGMDENAARGANIKPRVERDIKKRARLLREGTGVKFGFIARHRRIWPTRYKTLPMCPERTRERMVEREGINTGAQAIDSRGLFSRAAFSYHQIRS
jgi:hypothetical protein